MGTNTNNRDNISIRQGLVYIYIYPRQWWPSDRNKRKEGGRKGRGGGGGEEEWMGMERKKTV